MLTVTRGGTKEVVNLLYGRRAVYLTRVRGPGTGHSCVIAVSVSGVFPPKLGCFGFGPVMIVTLILGKIWQGSAPLGITFSIT